MLLVRKQFSVCLPLAAILLTLCFGRASFGEAMLQYFNTDWAEITLKMPELAEADYTSLLSFNLLFLSVHFAISALKA